jgi:hypothetical protein
VTRTESWSPRLRPIAANPMTGERARFRKRALRFNLGLALLVWIAWAVVGGNAAFHALFANWRVAVTMVFGSLVGGGTSEGGGAIAFPVFTKLLHIAAPIARNFSLAIQTVGMGAASLAILTSVFLLRDVHSSTPGCRVLSAWRLARTIWLPSSHQPWCARLSPCW